MAVIIAGMYEPDCCKDCYMSAGYGCEIKGQIMTTEEMKYRDEDCPIKSVEGLIEKLSKEQWKTGDPSVAYGFAKAIDIIKEYCEVEEG